MKYNKKQLLDQLIEMIEKSVGNKIDRYYFTLPKYNIKIWIANGIPFIAFRGGEIDYFPLSLWDKFRLYKAIKQASVNKLGDILTKG
jgi:hypothetical protein